jgi:hypothetical protein
LWLTSLNLSDVMRFVGAPNDGPKWHHRSCWCNVIVTSSRHCSRRRNVKAELWVLNFWIKFAMIRAKNASKYSLLVACDKQKTALVCFLSRNITRVVFLAG